jgi:hypothetical protein
MTEVATVAQMCLVASRWAKSGNGHPASTYQLVGGHEQTGQLGQCLDMILAGLRTVHDNCKLLEEQGGISMFRKLVIGALGAMAVLFSTTAFAQGTAADAKAMLEKTVAAIKADKAKTLDQINKGENGFLVGDIYPFCFNLSDGLLVAVGNPNVKGLLGKDARTFKDPTGDVYGPRLYDAAKEGQVNEVSYMSPKAGSDKTWVPKVSLVTAVAGLGCRVGYYK